MGSSTGCTPTRGALDEREETSCADLPGGGRAGVTVSCCSWRWEINQGVQQHQISITTMLFCYWL